MRRWLCCSYLILAMGWWRGCDTLAPPTVVYISPSRTPSVATPPVATPTLTAEVFLERGDNLARRGEWERAMADYDRTIQLHPDDAQAYASRAFAHSKQGRLDQAVADCERAMQLQPDLAQAFIVRGLVYQQKGDKERAIADFQQAVRLPGDPETRALVQQMLEALGAAR